MTTTAGIQRRYVGPDAAQAGIILASHGFAYRHCRDYIMASTSICHPEAGGRNLNLSIRNGPNGLRVKCFSHGCDSKHIRDALESLGINIRDYDPPYPRSRQRRQLDPPTPVAPAHQRYIDLAFPGDRIIHDTPSFRRLVPHGRCFCQDRAGLISISPLYHAGFRFHCDQGCSLSEIINSLTSQQLIILRRYRYQTPTGPIYRLRWDHATFGTPAKEYRGPGALDSQPRLKVWPHQPDTGRLIIVEGEKAAEAIASATTAAAPATWPNGVEAVTHVEYTPALDFPHVILWPDDDTPGRNAMAHIRDQLTPQPASIILNCGETGADAADCTPMTIRRIIRQHGGRP